MRRLAWLGLLPLTWAGVSLCPLHTARAAPTVEIRSRTQIQLDPLTRRFGGVVVRGKLTDQFSDVPVPWVDVRVRLGPYSAVVQTDGDGAFEAEFRARDGSYDLSAEFAGKGAYSETQFQISNMDITKGALQLAVTTDREADYSVESVRVTIVATSEFGGAAQVHTEVYAGPLGGDLKHMDSVTTDQNGRGAIALPTDRLGGPGRKRVQVRYGGDEAFNRAEASADFALVTPSATTLTIDDTTIAYESSVIGRGRITDAAGAGIPRAPVSLLVGSRRVGETLTDKDGDFALRVAGSEFGDGRFNVQAVFDPTASWHRSSRSEVIAVVIDKPRPIPIAYTVAAFVATALAMLAFVALRTQPWQGVLARWRRRAEKPESVAREGDDAPRLVRGLVPARPSLVSTLRRAHDQGFTGAVVDSVSGRPVPRAQVSLRTEHTRDEADPSGGEPDRDDGARPAAHEADADGAGRFGFEDLAHGRFRVRVMADGYVTERFAITVPHRGELRGARIDLLPVRERIFQIYRDAAFPLVPDRGKWGIWTPRQIFDHVRAQRPARSLRALTDYVEDAYFSQRTPNEDALVHAVELATSARAEAIPAGPTIPDAH